MEDSGRGGVDEETQLSIKMAVENDNLKKKIETLEKQIQRMSQQLTRQDEIISNMDNSSETA